MKTFNNGKPTLAYLCFPYSCDPKGNTLRGRLLALQIMKKHPNIFIVLPHTAVDMTLFGEFHERKKRHTTEDHETAETCEYIILSKIDLLIIGTEFKDMSPGMTWEHSFVLKLNRERKKQVSIQYAKEMLE